MHINDPNRSFSDFSQTTNGNISQFGVPTELNRRTTIIGRQSEQAQRERIRRHFGSRLSFFFLEVLCISRDVFLILYYVIFDPALSLHFAHVHYVLKNK